MLNHRECLESGVLILLTLHLEADPSHRCSHHPLTDHSALPCFLCQLFLLLVCKIPPNPNRCSHVSRASYDLFDCSSYTYTVVVATLEPLIHLLDPFSLVASTNRPRASDDNISASLRVFFRSTSSTMPVE